MNKGMHCCTAETSSAAAGVAGVKQQHLDARLCLVQCIMAGDVWHSGLPGIGLSVSGVGKQV
jgi:hypothetical protein